VLAVMAGGALGGPARYGLELALSPGSPWPWATYVANVVGAFVLALLVVLIAEVWPPRRYLRPFVAVGVLGSFTTFSTWMVETADLASSGRAGLAASYLLGSLFAGLAAAALGLLAGRALARRRPGREPA
jgi:CrcB protein